MVVVGISLRVVERSRDLLSREDVREVDGEVGVAGLLVQALRVAVVWRARYRDDRHRRLIDRAMRRLGVDGGWQTERLAAVLVSLLGTDAAGRVIGFLEVVGGRTQALLERVLARANAGNAGLLGDLVGGKVDGGIDPLVDELVVVGDARRQAEGSHAGIDADFRHDTAIGALAADRRDHGFALQAERRVVHDDVDGDLLEVAVGAAHPVPQVGDAAAGGIH